MKGTDRLPFTPTLNLTQKVNNTVFQVDFTNVKILNTGDQNALCDHSQK
jgi:hypothetical protein